jgi:hypothetical protein
MLVSIRWLRELCPVTGPSSALAEALTPRGITVDAEHPQGEDALLDLDVAANRPDCLGHLGVARELSAHFGVPLSLRPAAPAGSGPPVEAVHVFSLGRGKQGVRRMRVNRGKYQRGRRAIPQQGIREILGHVGRVRGVRKQALRGVRISLEPVEQLGATGSDHVDLRIMHVAVDESRDNQLTSAVGDIDIG